MAVDLDVPPDTSTPLADTVLPADQVRLLKSRVTSAGTSGFTIATAPFDATPLPAVPISSEEDVDVAFRTARRHQPA